jgi:hypothetical protein
MFYLDLERLDFRDLIRLWAKEVQESTPMAIITASFSSALRIGFSDKRIKILVASLWSIKNSDYHDILTFSSMSECHFVVRKESKNFTNVFP